MKENIIKSPKEELDEFDKLTIGFTDLLINHTSYVIVSGYVSILLGKKRLTEDIDLLVPRMPKEKFIILFNDLSKNNYECANTSNPNDAYEFLDEYAIRFFIKGKPTPNIEFKMIKTDLDKYSFENKKKVLLINKILFISPLELQIPYKLLLAADGTEEELQADKDIEDARYLYKLYKEKINKEEMFNFIDKLKVRKKARWLDESIRSKSWFRRIKEI